MAQGGGESGRALIRVDASAAQSLATRLSHWVERLTWRTPIHDMRLKGQHPPKLLAVPDDPFAGDAARGRAMLAGEVPDVVAGGAAAQGFAWLRDLAATGARAPATAVAEGLAARWLDAHGARVGEATWQPDVCATRLLMWTAHAPLLLSSTDLVFRSAVLNALARMARHLDRAADKVPAGAQRIQAWCGVVAAGLLLPGGDTRRGFGEAGLVRALATGLSEDGGLVSRSPAELLEVLATMAMLRAVHDARRADMATPIAEAMARMVPPLLGAAMGDGALSSWQGGAAVPAARVQAVLAACGLVGRPLRQARDWGYQRLAHGTAVVVMDAAPPPMVALADGGCASTLAFELSDGAERVVVNCGGAGLAAARGQAALAQGLRTTAAHSTLVVADANSTAVHGDGTLGRGVAEVELSRQESDAGSRIEARHDGYARRLGFAHRRQLVLTADGRELRGEDALLPAGRRRAGETAFALRFHLGAGVQAAATADGQAAVLRTPGGAIWQLRSAGGMLSIEDSVWTDGAGRLVPTQQIVVAGRAAAGGASIGWVLKKAR
jgi:uncharacterized heparinase superfamily protein